VLMNWIGYAVIFWGKARYRYMIEAVFCLLGAMAVSEVWRRRRARRTSKLH